MKDKKWFFIRIGGLFASIIGMICTAFAQRKENEDNIKKFVDENRSKSGK